MKSLAKIRKRKHRCYELAATVMLFEPGADRFTLVHGRISPVQDRPGWRIGHAWIELNNGCIYDAVEDSYESAERYMARKRAIAEQRYSHLEVINMTNVTRNYGPWFDEERAAATAGAAAKAASAWS